MISTTQGPGNQHPLHINSKFDYNIKAEGSNMNRECDCATTRPKVKSGKYAKNSSTIIKQEDWPHNAVSKKYAKRTSFEQMDFETFVAGESKIIFSMLATGRRKEGFREGLGRLKVLMLMSHWMCKNRDWSMLRSLFESIMDEVESGDCQWYDDFSSYETMIPPQAVTVEHLDRKPKSTEVYWCKAYQSNSCDQKSPHMAVIKSEEAPVPVLHICALCWLNSRKRREHPESDVACPSKKGNS